MHALTQILCRVLYPRPHRNRLNSILFCPELCQNLVWACQGGSAFPVRGCTNWTLRYFLTWISGVGSPGQKKWQPLNLPITIGNCRNSWENNTRKLLFLNLRACFRWQDHLPASLHHLASLWSTVSLTYPPNILKPLMTPQMHCGLRPCVITCVGPWTQKVSHSLYLVVCLVSSYFWWFKSGIISLSGWNPFPFPTAQLPVPPNIHLYQMLLKDATTMF